MNITSHLSRLDLRPRATAQQYQELYADLKDLALEQDNGDEDLSLRAGEVHIRGKHEDQYLTFGYQRDEGYVGEGLTVSQTDLDQEGKRAGSITLRGGPTDKSARYLKFAHLVDTDGQLGHEQATVVMVDTQTGTLFQEV